MTTEKALSTKGFHVDRHTVARLYGSDLLSYPFDNTHHFMANCNTGYGTGYTSMLDMQIAGTDTPQCDAYHSITRIFYFRHRFLHHLERAMFDISIG